MEVLGDPPPPYLRKFFERLDLDGDLQNWMWGWGDVTSDEGRAEGERFVNFRRVRNGVMENSSGV